MARLVNPRSIALAGVSSTPGSLAGIVLDNLERFGYGGDIHLLHPRETVLRGRRCVASAAELPEHVDCVVLAIPASAVLNAVRDCAARGVGGVVVFSAGFAELGPAGESLQREIAAVAARAGMAVAGPNCLGFVNYLDGVPVTFAVVEPHRPSRPGVAVVSQSGAMASVVRAALQSRALEVTAFFSTGNEAVNGLEDFIDYAFGMPLTPVIALVGEHIRQPQRFLALAREARLRGSTIVLLHPGRSAAARQSAQTHTGALVGDHAVVRAHAMQAGILWVETLEELVDVTECLLRCAKPPSGGTAIVCESGAFKAMAIDYCDTLRLDLPQPQGAQAVALDALAPGFIVASNPLDLTAQALANPELYDRAIEQLLASPACGSLVVAVILTSRQMADRKLPAVLEAMRQWATTRAVLLAMLGEDSPVPETWIAQVRAAGVPFFRSPERALRALAVFTKGSERSTLAASATRTATPVAATPGAPAMRTATPASAAPGASATRTETVVSATPGAPAMRTATPASAAPGASATRTATIVSATPAGTALSAATRLPAGVIPEFAAKDLLEAAGLSVGLRRLARTPDEAAAAAAAIGYPVALKIQSAALSHKSDVGGVILGLKDADAVAEGWHRLLANVARAAPDVPYDGVLVEEMAATGLEIIVGARNDADWGPVIAVGLGGVLAEAIDDVVLLPAGLGAEAIERELRRLRGARLFGVFRGRPARDLGALVAAIDHVGNFLLSHLEIKEIDINPILVLEVGHGVVVVDALIVSG